MKSDMDKFASHMHKTYGVSLGYIAMFRDPGAEEPEVLLSVLSLVQASSIDVLVYSHSGRRFNAKPDLWDFGDCRSNEQDFKAWAMLEFPAEDDEELDDTPQQRSYKHGQKYTFDMGEHGHHLLGLPRVVGHKIQIDTIRSLMNAEWSTSIQRSISSCLWTDMK
jgi:hypothetical protein